MAEGILRKKILEHHLSFDVDSAGTADYHVGEPPDSRAIATAKKFGVEISNLRGRQFTAKDFDRFDRIFAMDSSNYKNIIRLARNENDKKKVSYFWSDNDKGFDVPDPWFGDIEGFTESFKLLERVSEVVLNELKKEIR
jgi:protein-tyrosine phosphatase